MPNPDPSNTEARGPLTEGFFGDPETRRSDGRLILLVRDPTTLFALWEGGGGLEPVELRLHGASEARAVVTPPQPGVYFEGLVPGGAYWAEAVRERVGSPGERAAPFTPLVRLPPAGPSERFDVTLMDVPWTEAPPASLRTTEPTGHLTAPAGGRSGSSEQVSLRAQTATGLPLPDARGPGSSESAPAPLKPAAAPELHVGLPQATGVGSSERVHLGAGSAESPHVPLPAAGRALGSSEAAPPGHLPLPVGGRGLGASESAPAVQGPSGHLPLPVAGRGLGASESVGPSGHLPLPGRGLGSSERAQGSSPRRGQR